MWRSKKIGDILKMSIGSTPPKKGDNYNGDIPWVTISNLTTKDIKEYTAKVRPLKTIKKLPAGSLVGSFKMSVGRFGFLSEPSATNEAIIAIPPDATKENLMFLYYALPSVFKKNATLNGQGVPLLNTETIKKLDVILPPLAEQTAIANILSDQEALIAQYDNLIALHEKRFAYLSDELLSGRVRLVQKEVGEVELVRNSLWQEKELNGEAVVIPRDWNHGNVGTLFKIVGGGTPSSTEPKFWDGTIPWLGPKDMGTDKLFIKEGTKFLSDAGAAKLGKTVKRNSVIVSTRAPVGYINIAENDLYTNQGCQSLYSDQFDAVYVAQWLRLNKWVLDKNSAGSTFKELSSSNLKKIHIWYPPLPEQILIANVLSDQEALIAQYKKLRDAEKKRFDWLSDALLSGTYRVKVEP
jgi:type I restriction enzyme S subunit